MSELKVGQLRQWAIPVHSVFGKHEADGLIFRVVSIDEPHELKAKGKYVGDRCPYCHTTPEWMAANSVVIEEAS